MLALRSCHRLRPATPTPRLCFLLSQPAQVCPLCPSLAASASVSPARRIGKLTALCLPARLYPF